MSFFDIMMNMWFWVGIGIIATVALASALAYYFRLNDSAQDAVMFALPRRAKLEKFAIGRWFLSVITNIKAANEHHGGQIDLAAFSEMQMQPNPVVRGELVSRGIKRLIDIAVSLGLLVATGPVLILTALAVRLDSRGPIFYKQERVGRNGDTFHVIKFRSMTVDAESGGAKWAQKSDPRVTRVGKFIRKTRLDEIPQAFNILNGDMSFVGPRPERPEFTEMLAEEIPHYDARHAVKPGLTGWAQVSYPYGASVQDSIEKLKYDLYYLKNYSLILDFFIIIKTVRVTLKGIGGR